MLLEDNTQLKELFKRRPDALEFLHLYNAYVHLIDDIIDDRCTEPAKILEMQHAARNVFSHPFYQQNIQQLYVVEALNNDTYRTSVEWERGDVEWNRRHAACLRHCGYSMVFAVILITGGQDILTGMSSSFREQCHLKHIEDESEFNDIKAT